MQMFLETVNNNMIYIVLSMAVIILLFLIFLIILSLKLSKLKKRYERFTGGEEIHSENLENMLYEYNENVKKSNETYGKVLSMIQEIDDEMKWCTQKIGVIRYNPFDEMGGNLCYAVAILDGKDNGVVLNGIHSRNGTFTYAKPIERGVSPYVLTEEELQALEKAKENAYKPDDTKKIMKVIKPTKIYKTKQKVEYKQEVKQEENKQEMSKPQGGFDINDIAQSIFGHKPETNENTDNAVEEKKSELLKEENTNTLSNKKIQEIDEFKDFSAFDVFNEDIDKSNQ